MVGEFIDTIKRGYSFDYKGRSDRREYIIFQAGQFILAFCLGFYGGWTGTDIDAMLGLSTLVLMVPNIMVTIRRLHDFNISGWLFLPVVIAGGFAGAVGTAAMFLFIIFCIFMPGNESMNKYGDPALRLDAEVITIDEE